MERALTKKRFKPERVTAIIVTFGVFAFLGFLLSTYWAYLIIAAASPVTLSVILLVLGAILFMALDGPTRTLFRYMYMSLMRWVTGWFVKIDPVDVLHDNIKHLEVRMKDMHIQRDTLKVEIHKLMELVRNNATEIQNLLQKAHDQKTSNNTNQSILNSRKAARKRASNERLNTLLKKMQGLDALLTKMYDHAFLMVEDVKDRIEMKVLEREALTSGHSAMKNAMSILKGDVKHTEAFEQAMSDISEDVQGKIGKIEHFMDMSEHFIETIDLQNGIYEEQGLEMLEQWQKDNLQALGMEENTIEGLHPDVKAADQIRAQDSPSSTDASRYDELLDE